MFHLLSGLAVPGLIAGLHPLLPLQPGTAVHLVCPQKYMYVTCGTLGRLLEQHMVSRAHVMTSSASGGGLHWVLV